MHVERAKLAIGFSIAGFLLGGLCAPYGAPLAAAVLVGVFLPAVVLWAPTQSRMYTGLALVAVAAILLRVQPPLGVVALPAVLAVATAPGPVSGRWFLLALGVAVLVALPLMVALGSAVTALNVNGNAPPPEAAYATTKAAMSVGAVVAAVVAIVAIAVSQRVAAAPVTPR